MGMAMMTNKPTLFVKHTQTSFSTDWLHLRVAQMPKCQGPAIFVVTTTDRYRQTNQLLYPCTCARGNKVSHYSMPDNTV